LPLTEDHPLRPTNPYAISKAAADHYCSYLAKTGFNVVCARPFNHTGPGQSDLFVLSSFARQIARIELGKNPPVLRVGNIQTSRDFSHVSDVVRAYELLALNGKTGEAYNISSGRPTVVRDALDELLNLSSTTITVEQDPERMRPVDVPISYGSHEKLTADVGWRPEIKFETLLKELLDYWRERENA
jgi:GDP-4-dehydro-6-deoxy-D-mannose reductase